ncbi:MAG: hypothetical protein SGJ24_18975 [Chloroflexota bacterium]|nr:hypothetical protein [Chloroflexota bacterium]
MHAHFAEQYAPIDRAAYVAVTAEQNSGYVALTSYTRIAILIHAITVTTTLDVDIEIATSAAGANERTLKSMTQLVAADDDVIVCIDVRPDELTSPAGTTVNEFTHLNVEVTPNGAATLSVIVLGVPRSQPATGWTQAIG